MRKPLLLLLLFVSFLSYSQTNIISNNKSLAFMNPALQQDSMTKGWVQLSTIVNPLSESSNYINYLGLAEFKLNNGFHLGGHYSVVNTRLGKQDAAKLYGSYKYEFEQGNFLRLGIEAGMVSDMVKTAEFNKVFSPTIHQYTDSTNRQFDFGAGIAYTNQRLTISVGVNKINRPSFVAIPMQYWDEDPSDSTALIKKDTTVVLGSDSRYVVALRQNINLIYKWEVGNVKIGHYIHVSNLTLGGYDFLSFQNFIQLNNGVHFGLGLYENGNIAYMGSLGYSLNNQFGIEISAFHKEEFEFDPNAPFPQVEGFPNVNTTGDYVSNGRIPSFEFTIFSKF